MRIPLFFVLCLMCCHHHLGRAVTIPKSPCGIFTYRYHSTENFYFGYIKLSNVRVAEEIKLQVKISVAGSNVKEKSSLSPISSVEATYNEIVESNTASYWVKFPVQDPLPLLESLTLNGREICSGPSFKPPSLSISMTHVIQGSKMSGSDSSVDQQDICGTSTVATINLSVNGIATRKGQFPWAVPLFQRLPRAFPKYFCVGTIITHRHLLTAAHCVFDKRPENVLAAPGLHDISDFSDTHSASVDIRTIITHGEYVSTSEDLVDQDADIAVLLLKTSLRFTQYVRPICLWRAQKPLETGSNHRGVVTGWGVTEHGKTNLPFYITNTLVSKRQCSENMGFNIPQRARLFCGNGEGSVACRGDSGSALAMNRNNRYYLRGIVSKAGLDPETHSCDVNKYTIYTDAAKFMDWIVGNIDEED